MIILKHKVLRANMVQKLCAHTLNAKMLPVQTISGKRGGWDEFNIIYLIHCKNLCKCHNLLHTKHNNKRRKVLSSLSGISAISVSLDFLLRCYKF
jgi:hypothetical protein